MSVLFRTGSGLPVPAVTAEQMREVDRIAVEDFGLGVLQMMENAGRNLALHALEMLDSEGPGSSPRGKEWEVAVLAGSGGNGGGGLCCARHLHNRGFRVSLVLSREPAELQGPAANQLRILQAAGVEPVTPAKAEYVVRGSKLVVDAIIGYSLRGAPRGRVAELIDLSNRHGARVLSLDLPSGLDATTGQTPGTVVRSDRTLTLALPKTGLQDASGELYLADIGIPPELYERLGISFATPFEDRYWVRLVAVEEWSEKGDSDCPEASRLGRMKRGVETI